MDGSISERDLISFRSGLCRASMMKGRSFECDDFVGFINIVGTALPFIFATEVVAGLCASVGRPSSE
jgi:hypothetical protein